ncbi:MAG TPA: response regulator [Polyangiaceae bacterium]|jgi:DNA-binding response OmpR family regulator|nr:response regulator [Polyangiaceae bacterium]
MSAILFIADDGRDRARIAAALAASGHKVEIETYAGAKGAFERAGTELAIVSVAESALEALDVVRLLRVGGAVRDLPILALVPEPDVRTRLGAASAGATDQLAQPFEPAHVVLRVKDLLAHRAAPRSSPLKLSQKRVLVIDDSRTYAHALMHELRTGGLEPVFAETGADALLYLETQGADLAIVDVFLPDVNGIDLCRRMKSTAATAAMPVLVLTGRERSAVRDAATAAMADDFAVKGRDFAAIYAKVRQLLARPAARFTGTTRAFVEPPSERTPTDDGDLFTSIVRETGLSEVLAKSAVERVCVRLQISPGGLTRRDLPRLVEGLARTLQLFLPPAEAQARIAALNRLV